MERAWGRACGSQRERTFGEFSSTFIKEEQIRKFVVGAVNEKTHIVSRKTGKMFTLYIPGISYYCQYIFIF